MNEDFPIQEFDEQGKGKTIQPESIESIPLLPMSPDDEIVMHPGMEPFKEDETHPRKEFHEIVENPDDDSKKN